MGKLGALSILIVVAAMIYFFSPSKSVEVSSSAQQRQTPIQENTSQIEPSQTQESITTASKESPLEAQATDIHDHDHDSQAKEIPQYIKDSLEAKRIPASELVIEEHPDGSATLDLKGQFQHVPVAILGEDGKVKIVETTIQPKTE